LGVAQKITVSIANSYSFFVDYLIFRNVPPLYIKNKLNPKVAVEIKMTVFLGRAMINMTKVTSTSIASGFFTLKFFTVYTPIYG